MEYGKITDEGIAQLRAKIGKEKVCHYQPTTEINRDAILCFAHAIGDMNPLWNDEEYARKTKYGDMIAPPCILYSCSTSFMPGITDMPGVQGMWCETYFKWHRPIRRGDRIKVTGAVVNVEEKIGMFAGRSLLVTYRLKFINEDSGELVAETDDGFFKIDRSIAKKKGKYTKIQKYKYTDKEINAIQADYDSEEIRGNKPRYWEDVKVGEELRPVVKGPLTLTDMLCWYAAFRSDWVAAHDFRFRYFAKKQGFLVTDPEYNAPDSPEAVHWVDNIANLVGLPIAYDVGPQRASFVSHLLTNWMGDDGFLRSLALEARRYNLMGDTTWIKGKVAKKHIEQGKHVVDCEVWCQNQRGETTMSGTASVWLPPKKK
jgi:acyl dehydratase